MSVVAINRTNGGVLTSADSATLTITDSAGDIVVNAVTVAPLSAGVYSYTTSYLVPGKYTAFWTFTQSGWIDDTVSRPFVVDSPLESYAGITLRDLETRVARRCGSYRKIRIGPDSTINSVQAPRLRSSQNLGSFETEFVLRRGFMWNGSLIEDFDDDDRVRGVDGYSAADATITVDQVYTNAPAENELVEILYLDPDEELRPAVQEGLERCMFWDTITFSFDGLGEDVDLTAVAPWIAETNQVKLMKYGLLNSRIPPSRVQWWEPYRSGGHIYLRSYGVMSGNVSVTALRPHSSYVNEELSFTGPNDDLDILHVNKEYATWAGVLAMYANNAERLAPTANQKMRPTRDEIAAEFTKYSMTLLEQIPEFITNRWDYMTGDQIIGNLPEARV